VTSPDGEALADLLAERHHLLDVASRVLGRGPAAEDVVDEAYRAWYRLSAPERAAITSPGSWLIRVTSTCCLVRGVRIACETQSPDALGAVLAPDVTAWFDGGGKVRTADRPVRGRAAVVGAVLPLLAPRPGTDVTEEPVNGGPGLVVRVSGRVAAVVLCDTLGTAITDLWLVLNPSKLQGLRPP
jgi:RNA polymerase sigma-70 factor (ECF subfamily)